MSILYPNAAEKPCPCFRKSLTQTEALAASSSHNLAVPAPVFEKGAVVKDEWLVALRQLFKELDSARSSKACVAATQMASLMQSASTNGASLQKLTSKHVCVCACVLNP